MARDFIHEEDSTKVPCIRATDKQLQGEQRENKLRHKRKCNDAQGKEPIDQLRNESMP
jgi:hypothetical protein